MTEVFVTRVFDAPRDVVFKFWTEPEHLAKWWGPAGFHSPREDVAVDLRVGGVFRIRMVETAGGEEVLVLGEILELVVPELLVIHVTADQPPGFPPVDAELRIQLHDHGGRTRLTFRQGPIPADLREDATKGMNESLDKLAALLPTEGDPR
jgi:uncharacterized protein YndB with AHSA1/START domain